MHRHFDIPTVPEITAASIPWSEDCVTLDCASRERKIGAKLCDVCKDHTSNEKHEDRIAAYLFSVSHYSRKIYNIKRGS
jgi:hypothetical protein